MNLPAAPKEHLEEIDGVSCRWLKDVRLRNVFAYPAGYNGMEVAGVCDGQKYFAGAVLAKPHGTTNPQTYRGIWLPQPAVTAPG